MEKKYIFLLSNVFRLALEPNLVNGHTALFSKEADWLGSGNDHSPNLASRLSMTGATPPLARMPSWRAHEPDVTQNLRVGLFKICSQKKVEK
jgi:hypothetical protein